MIESKRIFNIRRILLFLILPLILYYIYNQLQSGWERLEHYQWSLNVKYLLLAFLMALAYVALGTWIWRRILSYLGSELSFWKSFRILQLAQLGKYLPGSIWAIGGQLYLGEKEGLSSHTLLCAAGLQWVYNLLSGAFIFLPLLLLYELVPLWVAVFAILVLLLLLGLVFFPFPLLRCVSSWLNLSSTEKLLLFSPTQSLAIFFSLVFAWLFFGYAFWSLINAFIDVPLGAYYQVSASFCGAWVLGAISFFTPAGMGVREGALVFLLGQFLLPSTAVIISIAARLWMIVVEFLCASIAWLVE